MTDMLQIHDAAATDTPEVLVFPHDENWNEARMAWNLAVEQTPAAVALPRTPRDVAEVVKWARARGYRIAAQGTGHNANPLAADESVVLVKTHLMRQVSIDAEHHVARAQAGAQWGDVVPAAAAHGLAALAGSSHDVGVVGYMLGGGLSFLARRYGLASNRVLAIEYVDADGELQRADRHQNAGVFWAMRGGGGAFGVVTAIEFELFAIPTVYAGALFFPIERAAEVLHAWREWTYDAPESITSVGRVLRFPPLPDLPPHLSGKSFALIEIISLERAPDADELIAPLRSLVPIMDTIETIPAAGLLQLHMDPPGPVPGTGDHQLLDRLPAAAIDALIEAGVAAPQSNLLSYEIRHLGGEVARGRQGNGALAAIDAHYATFGVGMAITPEMKEAVEVDLAEMRQAMAPFDAGREYLNFVERPTSAAAIFDEDALHRLRMIKGQVDPEDVFLSNHPIKPL
jgi:FAD/FMN-containing dehydrogenase